MPDLDDARQILKSLFGFPGFRRGQKRIIRGLLEGRSVLAVLPTGGGKSLCYQLPALLIEGLTLVVSPLIALMKDQVDFLIARGIAAARLDSTLDAVQSRQVYSDLCSGKLKLLYVAPERLASERFLDTLAGLDVALLAIDEAHCISQWGHNFRPEYLKLARLADQIGAARVLALTATATPQVARDIADAFKIADEDIVASSYHRSNLKLHATPCRIDERRALLMDRLGDTSAGPTIVYVTLQKTAAELAADLLSQRFNAAAYHAGLSAEERDRVQEAFMASDSMIVVATIAFGMGIDKADIRAVYHYNLSKSLENYAQEIGRAGRDGQPARCEVFACPEDATTLENFTYGDTPTPEALAGFLRDLLGRGPRFDVSVQQLADQYDIRPQVVKTSLAYLELAGVLEATGPSYAEYKIRNSQSLQAFVARRGSNKAMLLRRIIAEAREGREWLALDLDRAAQAMDRPREQIAGLLADLEVEGEAEIKVSGVRQGYRLVQDDADLDALQETMIARFLDRERRDIERVQQVLDFAGAKDCLTRQLLGHFGEELEEDCGHCARCLGLAYKPLSRRSLQRLDRRERELLAELRAEGHAVLATPRQLARFLCGLSSPATIRSKLTKDPRFGTLAHVPFAQVLALVEGRVQRNLAPG
jgi:ATP-dependent DNA helicase RecQ